MDYNLQRPEQYRQVYADIDIQQSGNQQELGYVIPKFHIFNLRFAVRFSSWTGNNGGEDRIRSANIPQSATGMASET